jgi:hypothetical protein
MAIEKLKLAEFNEKYSEGPKVFNAYMKTLEVHLNSVRASGTKFSKEMGAEAKAAKAREEAYKKINNARFFVKLQSGVSDTLKAKCLPLIKATQTAIADAVKSVKDEFSQAGVAMGYAEHLTAPSGCSASVRESFVNGWNDGICKWEAAEKSARDKVEAAKEKEKKATSVFDKYLKDKQAMKDLGGDDYKAFKKQYDDLAKTL